MPVHRSDRRQSSTFDILRMVAAVLGVVLLVLLLAMRLPTRVEAMHANWVSGVHAAVASLGISPTKERLEAAKRSLLGLTVASPDKEKHLALVLAIISLQDGKPDAIERLTEAVQAVGK